MICQVYVGDLNSETYQIINAQNNENSVIVVSPVSRFFNATIVKANVGSKPTRFDVFVIIKEMKLTQIIRDAAVHSTDSAIDSHNQI